MLKIGLTGNIGSGKSLVAEIFAVLGVPVYNADNNAKKLLLSDNIKPLLKKEFGDIIFDPNDQIIRKNLADIVFPDPEKLNILNSIIHPFVIKDFNNWVASILSTNNYLLTTKYLIIEAAILFESGYNTVADKIITVTCPESLRIKRIIQRDGISEEEIKHRMNNQWDENIKVERSDFIIVNDENQLLIPQIISIHNTLNSLS